MKKLTLILPLCVLMVAGCDDTTGPTYVQAPVASQSVMYGTIIESRPVQVATNNADNKTGAAIVGGLAGAIVGNQFGKGGGKTAMTGLGAIGGAMAGSALADNGSNTRVTRQWTVRLQQGGVIQVIQDGQNLYVGQRVRVIQDSRGTHIEP
ncbi:MAG: glycine zipper 2TM domain-containing protein [Rhodobacteraceae bacterium]|nr:glycine zipper 2TM domain-containing protein [Paracoccaceae bacterium]